MTTIFIFQSDVCCYSAVNANQLASFNTGKNELVVLGAGATGDASTFTCNSMYSYKSKYD